MDIKGLVLCKFWLCIVCVISFLLVLDFFSISIVELVGEIFWMFLNNICMDLYLLIMLVVG